MFRRIARFFPLALLLAVGTAAAGMLPVYQPVPRLQDGPPRQSQPEGYGNSFLWQCLGDLTRGQFRLAEAACSRAIDFDAKEASAYELRGYAYLLEHRFERAEKDFQAALRLRSNDDQIFAGYAQSLSGLGRFDEAVAQFDKAIALAPRNAAYLSARCWARAGTGTGLDRALADCNAALALAPGSAGPLNGRGLVELRLARYEAAIADYTASLAASRHQPSALFGRGLAKLAIHQRGAGRADIIEAREADSEVDSLFVTLGVLTAECEAGTLAKCPADFLPPTPAGKWLLARWLMP
ncbi:MAG TPA: tetratricopeptide repeat protein [Rhizomicrobium sp.]|nr:tetratricopeptide repeat protein [Rhizomicrobium sp.]